ncbi:hypothetical protein ACHAXS_005999, partial [Conticribra weissflogii]
MSTMQRSSRNCFYYLSRMAFASSTTLFLLVSSVAGANHVHVHGSTRTDNITGTDTDAESHHRNSCGWDWTDASRNCRESCPGGRDDECSHSGWRCFLHTGCAKHSSYIYDDATMSSSGNSSVDENYIDNETLTTPPPPPPPLVIVENPANIHGKSSPAADADADADADTFADRFPPAVEKMVSEAEVVLSLFGLDGEMGESETALLEDVMFRFLETALNRTGIRL